MSLRPDITDLEFHIVRQLALDGEVVLGRILAAHVRLKLSEQCVWSEHCPVCWLSACRIQDAVDAAQLTQAEWIGISEAPALVLKGSVEPGIEGKRASTEGRLSTELFQDKLLNRVIEQSPTSADACLTRVSRAPRQSDSRSKSFVVCLGQSVRHAWVSRHNQAGWEHRASGAGRTAIRTSVLRHQRGVDIGIEFTWVNFCLRPRPEGLHVLACVRDRSVELPAQTVVERQIWFDLPAILCK